MAVGLQALASPVATEPEPSPVAELSELVDTAPVGAKVTCVVEVTLLLWPRAARTCSSQVDGKVVGKWQGEPEQLKFEKLNSAPSSPRGGNHAELDEAHTSVRRMRGRVWLCILRIATCRTGRLTAQGIGHS